MPFPFVIVDMSITEVHADRAPPLRYGIPIRREDREIRRIAEESGHALEFAHVIDHLEEERRENLTIDTAQIPLRHPPRGNTRSSMPRVTGSS